MNPLAMMNMKKDLKENSSNNTIYQPGSNINSFTAKNLTQIEERIIKQIIREEVKVENSGTANATISLDEAIKRIKSGS